MFLGCAAMSFPPGVPSLGVNEINPSDKRDTFDDPQGRRWL